MEEVGDWGRGETGRETGGREMRYMRQETGDRRHETRDRAYWRDCGRLSLVSCLSSPVPGLLSLTSRLLSPSPVPRLPSPEYRLQPTDYRLLNVGKFSLILKMGKYLVRRLTSDKG